MTGSVRSRRSWAEATVGELRRARTSLALVAVPLAAVAYAMLERRRARRAEDWSRAGDAAERRVAAFPAAGSHPARAVSARPDLLARRLCATAAASYETAPDRGAPTIVLTMDVSGSMAARDLPPTRLRAARKAAIEFLDELPPNYKVALVTFGDQVRVRVPPTLDRAADHRADSRPRSLRSPGPRSETPSAPPSPSSSAAFDRTSPSTGFIRPGRWCSSRTARRPQAARPVDADRDRIRLRGPDQLGLRRDAAGGRDPAFKVTGTSRPPSRSLSPPPHDAATDLATTGGARSRRPRPPSYRRRQEAPAAAVEANDLSSINGQTGRPRAEPGSRGRGTCLHPAGIILSGLWFGRHA